MVNTSADADHIGAKRAHCTTGRRMRVSRKAQIGDVHRVTGRLERGCHACDPVRHDGKGLALAIGAHQQDSGSAVGRRA